MSELQDALDRWDSERSEYVINRIRSESDDVSLFVDAARRVANLDIEAAAEIGEQWLGQIGEEPTLKAKAMVDAALGITTEDDE